MKANDNPSALAAAAGIGHNNPPSDIELLQMRLATEHSRDLTYADNLVAATARVPQDFDDEETAKKVSDLVALINGTAKTLEAHRVKEKAPHLALERAVDSFFKVVDERLAKAKAAANRPLTAYLQRKDARDKAEQAAEAKRLRDLAAETQRKADEAAAANRPVEAATTQQQVAHVEKQADKAAVAAAPAAKPQAKARGNNGSTSSLRSEWKGVLLDRAQLDLEALRQHLPAEALHQAIGAYVRAGGRELAGAKIWEDHQAVTR